jgi:hypothetical protein
MRTTRALLALALVLALAGCTSPRESCEEQGGTYVRVGTTTILVPIIVGKTTIYSPRVIPDYECQVKR